MYNPTQAFRFGVPSIASQWGELYEGVLCIGWRLFVFLSRCIGAGCGQSRRESPYGWSSLALRTLKK
jgi:hypothetical protein